MNGFDRFHLQGGLDIEFAGEHKDRSSFNKKRTKVDSYIRDEIRIYIKVCTIGWRFIRSKSQS